MDNIWIFLVIIGAVVSFAQKNQSKRQSKSDKTTDAEHNDDKTLTPHEMLERRVREMLGEDTPQRVPSPKVTLPSQPAKPASKSIRTTTAQQRPAAVHNTKTVQSAATTTNNQPENGQNSKIIEEFTMEKAVIYSEILKPKFEEF